MSGESNFFGILNLTIGAQGFTFPANAIVRETVRICETQTVAHGEINSEPRAISFMLKSFSMALNACALLPKNL